MVKYEAEILTILSDLFRQKYMTDKDWGMYLSIFSMAGLDFQKLSDAIQQGVDNGHPLEEQLTVIKQFFNSPQWDNMKKRL